MLSRGRATRARPRPPREGEAMGAWETGSFDNDDALDWLVELSESSDLALIAQALHPEEFEGYLEAAECAKILCAGEVLAALHGKPAKDLPDELVEWKAANAKLDPTPYLAEAIRKVNRV